MVVYSRIGDDILTDLQAGSRYVVVRLAKAFS